MKHQSTVGAKGDLVNILLDILKAFLILFIYRELSKLYFEKVPFLLYYQRRSCERVWELRPLMIFIDNIQHSFSSVAINKAKRTRGKPSYEVTVMISQRWLNHD